MKTYLFAFDLEYSPDNAIRTCIAENLRNAWLKVRDFEERGLKEIRQNNFYRDTMVIEVDPESTTKAHAYEMSEEGKWEEVKMEGLWVE